MPTTDDDGATEYFSGFPDWTFDNSQRNIMIRVFMTYAEQSGVNGKLESDEQESV